jgi:hypothetical protein
LLKAVSDSSRRRHDERFNTEAKIEDAVEAIQRELA